MNQLLKDAHSCFLDHDTIAWEDMLVFDPRDDNMPYFIHVYIMRYIIDTTDLVRDL